MRKVKTDRHLSVEMFLDQRPDWLRRERKFLMDANLLITAPPDYDPQRKQNWSLRFGNGSFVINGLNVVNGDEVPFTLDWSTRQLVIGEERIALGPNALPNCMSKYRMGTLFIFTTPKGPLLTVIIFRKGKEGVRTKLRGLRGNAERVLYTANETGSITPEIWIETLKALAQRTTVRRGVRGDALRWKRALALYVDNHGTHLNKEIAEWARQSFGIYIRPLLPNTSHLMQPVDQNYGVQYKNLFKKRVTRLVDGIQMLKNLTNDLQFDIQKWRELSVRVVAEIVLEVWCLIKHDLCGTECCSVRVWV